MNDKSPLFEDIKLEEIESSDDMMFPENEIKSVGYSKLRGVLLVVSYLFIFISNDSITIPIVLALPEILINYKQVSFDILFPSIMGVLGVLLFGIWFWRKCQATSSEKTMSILSGFGESLLFVSVLYMTGLSSHPWLSLLTATPFGTILFISYCKQLGIFENPFK